MNGYVMLFCVQREIFEPFPDMRIVAAVAHGIDNSIIRSEVSERWQQVWPD
jgi:hypothetical protein